jgi:cell volume regulation protein A
MDVLTRPEQIMLAAAVLLMAGIVASRLSSRLGVPALLFFLLIGMLAGSEGPGRIPFDDPAAAQFVGVIALAFILFAGGLDTDRRSITAIMWQGLSLSTLGVLLTAIAVGWAATWLLGVPMLEGMLLGAIVSSTDAAAVFAVLRSQRIGLKGATKPLLELESGSNDPMAVFLTAGMISLLTGASGSLLALVPMFFQQMIVGAAVGMLGGRGAVRLINLLRLESEGLYPVFTIAAVLLTYGAASLLGGNGFLAVYLAGIVMGNAEFIHKRSLMRFHDGIAWLMQMVMFLVLGLLVFPSRLLPVAGVSLVMALYLIVVARPLAVLIGLAAARLRFRQKVLVSWVGLRGAVPIVLATFPYLAGLPQAELYFDVVFFIVLTSVLIQGTTITKAARLLRLDMPLPTRRQYPIEFVPTTKTDSDLVEVEVTGASPVVGRRIMDLRLPRSALIVLVGRSDGFVAPNGSTVLERGDTLLVLADKSDIPRVRTAVGEPPAES